MIIAPCNLLTIPEKYLNPNWEKAIEWLRAENWKNLEAGKTPIDGDRVFVSFTKNMNKPLEQCRYETHRLYADIQIVLKGVELVDVCTVDNLQVTQAYSAEKDIEFWDGKPELVHRTVLAYPLALALFPEDVHKPSIALGNPQTVEKIVLKVALR